MVESLEGIPWSETGKRIGAGYNGLPVGPTLIVKPGDTMRVTLRNSLPPSSDLDKELYAYVHDHESDETNVTIITNRLSNLGAYVSAYLKNIFFLQGISPFVLYRVLRHMVTGV